MNLKASVVFVTAILAMVCEATSINRLLLGHTWIGIAYMGVFIVLGAITIGLVAPKSRK